MHQRKGQCARLISPLTLSLLGLSNLAGHVRAWSRHGHQRIVEVIEKVIDGRSMREALRLSGAKHFSEFSDLEEAMQFKSPVISVLHWHTQQPALSCEGLRTDGFQVRCDSSQNSGSLFCALTYLIDSLGHHELLKEYEKPTVTADALEKLPALTGYAHEHSQEATYLRLLIALLGDLHQPLHWFEWQDYGREIQLEHKGNEYSLLQFWEEVLPSKTEPLSEAKIYELQSDYADFKAEWEKGRKHPIELIQNWASEVSLEICENVIQPMEESVDNNKRKGIDGVEYRLDQQTYQKWVAMTERYLHEGGQRIAWILTDLLHHRRHEKGLKEGRSFWNQWKHHHVVAKHSPKPFRTNLTVAIFLVPSLLVFFQWHRNGGRLKDISGPAEERLKAKD
eukprot:TRINITY_DN3314_c0_g1_i1.p1 TRINITY_DN3314_c0_g1~~TRINITY_DN3314_c0_g1_i1.p1  ORF type:complete len:394 (+),score=61.25 TRINITY_DN3314_c0_g1_i1:295-1476(+)